MLKGGVFPSFGGRKTPRGFNLSCFPFISEYFDPLSCYLFWPRVHLPPGKKKGGPFWKKEVDALKVPLKILIALQKFWKFFWGGEKLGGQPSLSSPRGAPAVWGLKGGERGPGPPPGVFTPLGPLFPRGGPNQKGVSPAKNPGVGLWGEKGGEGVVPGGACQQTPLWRRGTSQRWGAVAPGPKIRAAERRAKQLRRSGPG